MAKKPASVEKLFMIMHSSVDGVGGDIIEHGENYNQLMGYLIGRYDLIYEFYGDQIDEEEPEVGEYIAKARSRKRCTRENVREFDLEAAGITLRCSELFVGEKGFHDLIQHIEKEYCDRWLDFGDEPGDEECAALLKKLGESYDDDEALDRILATINEKIWSE